MWTSSDDKKYSFKKLKIHPMITVWSDIYPQEDKAYLFIKVVVIKITIKIKTKLDLFREIEERIKKLKEVLNETDKA